MTDPVALPTPTDRFEPAGTDAAQFDVFLAFNSKDDVAARSVLIIEEALKKNGKRAWLMSLDVPGGDRSAETMPRGIRQSRCVAMLHGPGGLGEWQGSFELDIALNLAVKENKRLFAVLLPGSGPHRVTTRRAEHPYAGSSRAVDRRREAGRRGILALLATLEGKSPRQFAEEMAPHAPLAAAAEVAVLVRSHRALLISVGTFGPGLSELRGPPVDAERMRSALEEANLPEVEWEVTHCENPDRETLEAGLRDFFLDDSQRDGVALVYYSGHGQVHSNDSYLFATDTDVNDISWTATPATKIVDLVKRSPAAAKIVIVDCCRAAQLVNTAYDQLGEDTAVLLASRGPAEDALADDEPSPFTAALVEAFVDPRAYGGAGLTTGDVLNALHARERKPWTNKQFAGHILLAAPAERPEPPPTARDPGLAIELAATTRDDDRLQLVRQLAITLDGLLAIAHDERQIPTLVVSETIALLAGELRRMTGDQLGEVDAAWQAGDPPTTCAVGFEDDETRSLLAALPWEYLAVAAGAPEHHGRGITERLRCPPLAVERVFPVPVTKSAGRATTLQHIALFSSLKTTSDEDVHPLTSATEAQLAALRLKPDVVKSTKWQHFSGAPDNADVVILQTPVWLVEDDVKVVFVHQREEEGDVLASDVIKKLRERNALSWLLFETVADSNRQSATAVRQLADAVASALRRPVVAVCHSQAYVNCVRENPEAETFVAHLVKKVGASWSLDHAAHAAREAVVTSLALRDPSIIGFPVVMRPVERESGPRPAPRA